jgi:hypothetical protein
LALLGPTWLFIPVNFVESKLVLPVVETLDKDRPNR